MWGRREPAHVDADLGDDGVRAEGLDARDRRDQLGFVMLAETLEIGDRIVARHQLAGLDGDGWLRIGIFIGR